MPSPAHSAHDAPMTTDSSGLRVPELIRGGTGTARRPARFTAALLVGAAGVVGACTSTGSGPAPATPLRSPQATTTGSRSGTSMASSEQAHLVAACTQLQAAGASLSDTWQRYTKGQTTRAEVLAAARNAVNAAQNVAGPAGTELRSQVQQVRTTAQAFAATLQASPPPAPEQIRAAAQPVLDALQGLQAPCASASASPATSPSP